MVRVQFGLRQKIYRLLLSTCKLLLRIKRNIFGTNLGKFGDSVKNMINIALFEPEIPPNTGNIIRLAANTGCELHLIEPLGFTLDDRKLRRAGLDYHEFAGIHIHKNWRAFVSATGGATLYGLSTKGSRHYHEVDFASGDFLIFGPETRGLPDAIRAELGVNRLLRIPMRADSRSLNLSNAAALVTYEAWRQLDFDGASN